MTPNKNAPHRPPLPSTGNPEFDAMTARWVAEAIALAGPEAVANPDLFEQHLRQAIEVFAMDPRTGALGLTTDGFTGQVINLADALREDQKLWMRIGDDAARLTRHMAKFPGSKAWICGSARTPEDSTEFALVVETAAMLAAEGLWVVNGGGPGAMRASTIGAGARAVQVGIELPFEDPSDDEMTVTLAKFFIRKLGMLRHAKVVAVAPGGLGTDEELKEVLTLIQTGKQPAIPVYLFDEPGTNFWDHVGEAFNVMIAAGKMSAHDRSLYTRIHTPAELQAHLRSFYSVFHSYVQIDNTGGFAAGTTPGWISMRLQPGSEIPEAALTAMANDFADIIPTGTIEPTALTEKELRRIERGLAAIPAVAAHEPVFARIAADDWSDLGELTERDARVRAAFDAPVHDPAAQHHLGQWHREYAQPRIGFWFNNKGYARLNQMIQHVNQVGRPASHRNGAATAPAPTDGLER